jgi:hypothetical protein
MRVPLSVTHPCSFITKGSNPCSALLCGKCWRRVGAAQAPPSALHPTSHAMLGAGCLEGDAALKHEGSWGLH